MIYNQLLFMFKSKDQRQNINTMLTELYYIQLSLFFSLCSKFIHTLTNLPVSGWLRFWPEDNRN